MVTPSHISDSIFRDRDVGIVPFPALGDTTVYLRLAQSLAAAGARLTIYSNALTPAADLMPWISIREIPDGKVGSIFDTHELVIADVLAPTVASHLASTIPENLIAVTARRMPDSLGPLPLPRLMKGRHEFAERTVHRAFCPTMRHGLSMVDWVDRYAAESLGLSPPSSPPTIIVPRDMERDECANSRILIFPTTPNPSKNYPLAGFRKLAGMLSKRGWAPEIVCMPNEAHSLQRIFPPSMVRTFPDLRALILHMLNSHAVISNDSGGGHLGSMMGLKTLTITKKGPDFVWRPGFSADGLVISPTMTFKWFSGRIWRPFIPLRRIIVALGTPHK